MELSIKKLLTLALSMKYITNATILFAIVGYYTQAYNIFLVSIPLLITNAIVISLVQWFNANELVSAVLDVSSDTQYPNQKSLVESQKTKFIFFNTIWHWLPLAWVWYILNKDNLIEVFRPNFMGCFLAGSIFGIIYFYFASQGKYYGNIDYHKYLIIYVIILFITSVCVYK